MTKLNSSHIINIIRRRMQILCPHGGQTWIKTLSMFCVTIQFVAYALVYQQSTTLGIPCRPYFIDTHQQPNDSSQISDYWRLNTTSKVHVYYCKNGTSMLRTNITTCHNTGRLSIQDWWRRECRREVLAARKIGGDENVGESSLSQHACLCSCRTMVRLKYTVALIPQDVVGYQQRK